MRHQRFDVPLDAFVSGYSQRFNFKRMQVKSLRLSGKRPDGTAFELDKKFQESGLAGFDVSSWVGIFAPAKTPQRIVDKLQRELQAALRTPFVRERYATLGIEPVGNAPREFFEQVRADLLRWAEVVKAANVKVD